MVIKSVVYVLCCSNVHVLNVYTYMILQYARPLYIDFNAGTFKIVPVWSKLKQYGMILEHLAIILSFKISF
jgi:hypothetical protein